MNACKASTNAKHTARAVREQDPAHDVGLPQLHRRLTLPTDELIPFAALSNSRLEGISAKIWLIQPRGYRYRKIDSLVSMSYRCLGGVKITLPTEK